MTKVAGGFRSPIQKDTSGLDLHLSGYGLEGFLMKNKLFTDTHGPSVPAFLSLSLHYLTGTLFLEPSLGFSSSEPSFKSFSLPLIVFLLSLPNEIYQRTLSP